METDDDDISYYGMGVRHLASCLIEEEPLTPEFTGLLNASGKRIIRIPVPKPRFGFPIFPDDNLGFDNDTDNDYFYGLAQ